MERSDGFEAAQPLGAAPPASAGLTGAQAARARAAARQAATRQQAGGARAAVALPAASAGDSEGGSGDSDEEGDEEEQEGQPGGKRPAARGKGKAGAEAERERKRCVPPGHARSRVPSHPQRPCLLLHLLLTPAPWPRMRRLLRNRVSAQLARERKKQHAEGVELRAVELESKASTLAARLNVLERENSSLRQARGLTALRSPTRADAARARPQVLRTTLGHVPRPMMAPPVI